MIRTVSSQEQLVTDILQAIPMTAEAICCPKQLRDTNMKYYEFEYDNLWQKSYGA